MSKLLVRLAPWLVATLVAASCTPLPDLDDGDDGGDNEAATQPAPPGQSIEMSDATAASQRAIFAPLVQYMLDEESGSPRVAEMNAQIEARLTDADAKILFDTAASFAALEAGADLSAWSPPPGLEELQARYADLPYLADLAAAPGVAPASVRPSSPHLEEPLGAAEQALGVPFSPTCQPPSCTRQALTAAAYSLVFDYALGELFNRYFGSVGGLISSCFIDNECTDEAFLEAVVEVGVTAVGGNLLLAFTITKALLEGRDFYLEAYGYCINFNAQPGECCIAPEIECVGTCVEPQSDFLNCGGCGIRCESRSCIRGECVSDPCQAASPGPAHGTCAFCNTVTVLCPLFSQEECNAEVGRWFANAVECSAVLAAYLECNAAHLRPEDVGEENVLKCEVDGDDVEVENVHPQCRLEADAWEACR